MWEGVSMLTTIEAIVLAREARTRHETRVFESERKYKEDIKSVQADCPHEFSDIKHVCDFNDCCYYIRYCTACGKELE